MRVLPQSEDDKSFPQDMTAALLDFVSGKKLKQVMIDVTRVSRAHSMQGAQERSSGNEESRPKRVFTNV